MFSLWSVLSPLCSRLYALTPALSRRERECKEGIGDSSFFWREREQVEGIGIVVVGDTPLSHWERGRG